MPKENTHLLFARTLTGRAGGTLARLAEEHGPHLWLGCVAPDVFFYASSERVRRISKEFHAGAGGRMLELFLKAAGETGERCRGADLVFALGFASHFVLDLVFHPVIDGLTGDYYDPDTGLRQRAVTGHRLLETAIDRALNQTCFVDEMVEARLAGRLAATGILAREFGVEEAELLRAWRNFHWANRIFRNGLLHRLARLLERFGWRDGETVVPLFLAEGARSPWDPKALPYRENGEERTVSAGELFDLALRAGMPVLETAAAGCHVAAERQRVVAMLMAMGLPG